MFTGTVEAKSHEGGLLVHFDGSSPALNAIMVRADDGSYIGKVDGVIGSTDHPLAHIAHIDRSLDMDALIGVIRFRSSKKKPRKQRNDRSGDDRRQGGRTRDQPRIPKRPERRPPTRRKGPTTPTYETTVPKRPKRWRLSPSTRPKAGWTGFETTEGSETIEVDNGNSVAPSTTTIGRARSATT